MEQERVFICESRPIIYSPDIVDKLKIGEVFRLQNGDKVLSCIQCSKEYEYFSEFTLHIEEHYLHDRQPDFFTIKMEEQEPAEMIAHSTNSNDDFDVETSVKLEENEVRENDGAYETVLGDLDRPEVNINAKEPIFVEGEHFQKMADKRLVCLTCDAEKKEWYDMKNHLLTHFGEKNVYCPLCLKSFINVPYVRKHLYRNHKLRYSNEEVRRTQSSLNVEIPHFDDDKTKMSFLIGADPAEVPPKTKRVSKKMKQKPNEKWELTQFDEDKFYCPLCFKSFINVPYVRKHLDRNHKLKYTSEDVRRTQKSLGIKTPHFDDDREKMSFLIDAGTTKIPQKSSRKVEPSDEIAEQSVEIISVNEHAVVENSSQDIESEKLLRCLLCDKSFKCAKSTQRHIAIEHNQKCSVSQIIKMNALKNGNSAKQTDKAEDEFSGQNETVQAEQSNPQQDSNLSIDANAIKLFKCFECGKALSTVWSLKKHLLRHSNKEYSCPLCQKKYLVPIYVRNHVIATHGMQKEDFSYEMIPEIASQPKSTAYECYLCHRTFRSEYKLCSHMSVHRLSPNYCRFCGKLFNSLDRLSEHIQLHKNKPTIFKCSICEKLFATKKRLQVHTNSIHGQRKEKRHVCELCGWAFNHLNNYKKHVLTHSKSSKVKCDICNKEICSRYIDEHKLIHGGKKQFQCDKCAMQFITNKRLATHMLIHSDEFKFKCLICTKAYRRSDKLLVHRRTHAEPLDYTCSTCDLGFFTERAYRLHEKIHIIEKQDPQLGQ